MATEATKILIAFISILLFHSREELVTILKSWNLSESLQVAALPAILYAIQNILIQHGYIYLNSLTFNLLNQTKVTFQ
jgi:solute carrier family 35 (UDP-sugar transporter), member A1/2/3